MKTTVSTKGQITIPKRLRAQLGLHPGVRLDFAVENGRLVASKRLRSDPFTRWRGSGRLTPFASVDDFLKGTRHADRAG